MSYTYETKCRRCGNMIEWYFANSKELKWTQFSFAMDEYIKEPRLRKCRHCNKSTVQDVVSYTDFKDLQP